MASESSVALSGLAEAHSLNVFCHSSYDAMSDFLWPAKYSVVSGETNHFSSGRPSDSRAESW